MMDGKKPTTAPDKSAGPLGGAGDTAARSHSYSSSFRKLGRERSYAAPCV